MGAANVAAAFHRWAGKVPGTSMQVLLYMALVSKDKDAWPWYGQGQESLAEFALGRENPGRNDVRAVSRAMEPLLKAGAVTVDRAAAARKDGNTTARYRLNLTDRSDAELREWEQTHDGKRRQSKPARDPQRTTVSGHDVRRFPTQRTTESDATYDGNRRTKEEEEEEEVEDRGIYAAPTTASHPSRASELSEPAPVIALYPDSANAPDEKPYRAQPRTPPPVLGRRWSTRGMDTVAEAMARCEAARAAHQAKLAAEQEIS